LKVLHLVDGIGCERIRIIDWWQWVLFAEAGRVAGNFDLSNLKNDLHTDVGFGMRVYSQGIVARLDFALADEGWAVLAMVGHPF
jgi:outer membrane translocation and assembly module TamA